MRFDLLAFLFKCNQLNRGLIRMDFDEAAFLYKTIFENEWMVGIEIGRARGGSAILILAAMDYGRNNPFLYSIDCNSSSLQETDSFLSEIGARDYIDLVVGRSTDKEIIGRSPKRPEFVFIDGDHTYEGAKADYENYGRRSNNIFFHDMYKGRPDALVDTRLEKLYYEIKNEGVFEEKANVGSLVYFTRK